jgi:hypothetical protein
LEEQFKEFKAVGNDGKVLNESSRQVKSIKLGGNTGKLFKGLLLQSSCVNPAGNPISVSIKLVWQFNDVSVEGICGKA